MRRCRDRLRGNHLAIDCGRGFVLAAVLAWLALLLTGCVGSSSPSVASLAATAATGRSGVSPPSPAGSETAASAPRRGAVAYHGGGAAFSACMRSHGVSDFPDPTFTNGNIGQRGIDPDSPQFEAAGRACASLDPCTP